MNNNKQNINNQSQNQQQNKGFTPILHEFTDIQRKLIIECVDDKFKNSQDNASTVTTYKAINVDPKTKHLTIIEKEEGKPTRIIVEIGGNNVPTIQKLLDMLEVKVTCEPLEHNFNYRNQNQQRGEHEKSKETKQIK